MTKASPSRRARRPNEVERNASGDDIAPDVRGRVRGKRRQPSADTQGATDTAGTGKLTLVAIEELRPNPRNPRKHTRAQVRAIARSIEAFNFNAPVLVNKRNEIVVGHGRYEAALLLGLKTVPVIRLDHLSEEQARAYMIADNKLSDRSSWDDASLALHLKEMSQLALDFEIEAIGFERPRSISAFNPGHWRRHRPSRRVLARRRASRFSSRRPLDARQS